MEKYDRESNVRTFSGRRQKLFRWLLILFSVYCIFLLYFPGETRMERASFVGLLVFFVVLLFPPTKKFKRKHDFIPWYDVVIALVGAFSYFYFVVNWERIANQGLMLSANPIERTLLIILGIIGILITFESCRRAVGLPIVIVAAAFIIYALSQKSLRLNVYNLFYTTEGIIGTPIRACINYIVMFVIFGAFLERTGISHFFIDIANSIAGASSGGPAKVAVISSALCGMVSGSSVGNTVTTGSITIPLMKKTGYAPEFAGAVEAAASTGGQIMPPIMGAAAFLMIDYIGLPYKAIALKAILPAALYFTGIFIMVHLEAKRLGLKGIPRDQLPRFFRLVARRGYLLLPLVILIYLLIAKTMALAAIFASCSAVVIANIEKTPVPSAISLAGMAVYVVLDPTGPLKLVLYIVIVAAMLVSVFSKKEVVVNITKFLDALENGARSVLTVGIACAVAGCIACVVTTTGIATKLTTVVATLSGGHLIIAMFFTMIVCIILGMGVPTTANFVIMATTCAPILINMNMDPVSAYFFVFYFGIVADITPPVALAAYAGAAIAGAKPMKTAFNATKLAIAAFIIPYIFGLSPSLLFVDTTFWEVILIIITSFVGLFGVAMGVKGFFKVKLPWWQRIIAAAGGLCLIKPGILTDVIGIAAVVLIIVIQFATEKRQRAKAA
ncbi:MAG: TRAP transporter fused permease subunit [Oscillospiraceae bacterium]|nr:TRAP transporter fused permease subunit [Oscillospiraceae bacterium]